MWSSSDHIVGGDQLDVAARSRRALHADLEIDDFNLVLDKGPAGFAVLAAPFRVAECGPIPFLEKSYPAIGEGIDHRRRTEGRIVVELGARPVDIPGVEEAQQPVVGAVERAADERRDMRRADQPVPRDDTNDLDIIFRKAKRRRFSGPAKARSARLFPDSSDNHTPHPAYHRASASLSRRYGMGGVAAAAMA